MNDITSETLNAHQLLPENMKSEMLKMLLSLCFLLGMFLVGAYVFKKLLRSRGHYLSNSSIMQIVAKQSLTPKTSIYLLRVENKTLVIAESSDRITLLTEFPTDAHANSNISPEEERSPSKLSEFLEKTMKKLHKTPHT